MVWSTIMRSRRNLLKKGCLLLLAILFGAYCLYELYQGHLHSIWMNERKELIAKFHKKHQLHKSNSNNNKLNLQGDAEHDTPQKRRGEPACVIPNLDPFSKEVINFMKYVSETCNVKVYGKISDGVYTLKGQEFSDVAVEYMRRARKDGEITDDFAISYSRRIPIQRNENGEYKLKLEEDHIKVSMIVWEHTSHYEFHSHVVKTEKRLRGKKKLSDLVKGIPMNIAMLMFDSQSRANFQRQTLKTIEYLQRDENTVILEGHTIVGDGTTAQLSAFLTGVPEKEQPESRRGLPNTAPCDRFKWIFKDFHKAGYLTAFGEDDTNYGSFYYRLNGFMEPPTTWYLRPFWLAQDRYFKEHKLCAAQRMMGLTKQFNEMFPDHAKFSLFTITELCHNNWNNMQLVDQAIVNMVKYFQQTQNTMFIVFGDHGPRTGGFRGNLQGKMEERLPFYSITLPGFFKSKYPELFHALKENSRVLTTHFDVYATFRHVLLYPNLPNGANLIGQSLFTLIDPQTRTCASAGVDEHWCPCLDYTSISPADKEVQRVAAAVVEYINKMILLKLGGEKHKQCAKLRVDTVVSAGVRTPKKIVQKFMNTKRNKKCDSCAVILNESVDTKASSIKVFEIIIVALPSRGKFEANAKLEKDGTIIVDPNISRINLYGNQPKCIMDEFPHARPFCYCV